MSNKQKLELTWIGKDKRPKLEPRILLEDPALSYHARQRVSEGGSKPGKPERRPRAIRSWRSAPTAECD
jgi:hypothetical protein